MLSDFRLIQPDGRLDLDFTPITDPTEVAVTLVIKQWSLRAPPKGDSNAALLQFLNNTPEDELIAIAKTAPHVTQMVLMIEAKQADTHVSLQIKLDDGTAVQAQLVLKAETGLITLKPVRVTE